MSENPFVWPHGFRWDTSPDGKTFSIAVVSPVFGTPPGVPLDTKCDRCGLALARHLDRDTPPGFEKRQ